MKALIEQIRTTARQLLEERRVDVVLGFESGPVPLRSAPCFVRSADEADRLTWDWFCAINLAVFLHGNPRRIAVFAKGCDSRAIVNLVKERQIVRERLLVVGVPCRGMIDRAKAERLTAGAEIEAARVEDQRLVVTAGGKKFEAAVDDVLRDACRDCILPTPKYCDVLLDSGTGRTPAQSPVEAAGTSDRAARWERFEAEAAKCIRCYACRNVCPLCYCRECRVDQAGPRWIGTAPDPTDNALFLLMRAMHLAGRCVDCGACVDACPVGVDVRHLFRRLEREVRVRFGHVSGIDLDEKLPLATYAMSDPEDFITDIRNDER